MYAAKKLEFLTDEQDTVEHYELKGKSVPRPSHNDQLMAALSSLDRIQQVEAITGMFYLFNVIWKGLSYFYFYTEYQTFSNELKEYLKKFADNKKIVRPEDIAEFFTKLKERKRRRMDDGHADGTPSHFCRWTHFLLILITYIQLSFSLFTFLCLLSALNDTWKRTLQCCSPK